MKCPNCRNELEELKGRYICTAGDCGLNIAVEDYAKVKQEYETSRLAWHLKLCRDDSLWHRDTFEEYPSIIAHEYWRLYDLLENGHTYGALLQLKDLFEVLIKFPTLILAARLYHDEVAGHEISDREQNVLLNLMKKPLSLGDWLEQARVLAANPGNQPQIEAILKDMIKIFDSNNLVNWRNEELGHGALGFDSSEKFQEEMKHRINLVKTHFNKFDDIYRSIKVYLAGAEEMVLQGKDRLYELGHDDGELCLSIGTFQQTISPYIVLRDQGIYFYDSYYIRKETTSILDYPRGNKSRIREQNLARLFSRLNREQESTHRKYTSGWLHLEAGVASALNLPVFVLCQKDLCSDGVFDRDWFSYPVIEIGSELDAKDKALDVFFDHIQQWLRTIQVPITNR